MGSVITFYSFKGGVGRTMALANIAILLGKRGLRVLVVDADLEAPGLNRYFQPHGLPPVEEQAGLIELLAEAPSETPPWEQYVSTLQINGGIPLTILTSGKRDATYARRVLELDWDRFFREGQGGNFFEALRDQWKQAFDIVLIDSRTGLTDSGGVLTIQMPDILVLVASPNHQSISGVREVAERAQAARQKLPYDRMPLSVLPILSRLDTRAEYEQSREWQETFAQEMEGFYADWLPKPFTPRQIIEQTKLPYVAYFSFGEKLPVVTEGTSDPDGLGFVYESLAALLAKDLADAEQIVERRDTYIASNANERLFDLFIWASEEDYGLAARLKENLISLSPALRVFSGPEDAAPGDFIPDIRRKAAETAHAALVFSDDFGTLPDGADSILDLILARARKEKHAFRLLPIHVGYPPSRIFRDFSPLRWNSSDQDFARKVLDILERTRRANVHTE
jgi:cellulose biosynthesis protein BcsQ